MLPSIIAVKSPVPAVAGSEDLFDEEAFEDIGVDEVSMVFFFVTKSLVGVELQVNPESASILVDPKRLRGNGEAGVPQSEGRCPLVPLVPFVPFVLRKRASHRYILPKFFCHRP